MARDLVRVKIGVETYEYLLGRGDISKEVRSEFSTSSREDFLSQCSEVWDTYFNLTGE